MQGASHESRGYVADVAGAGVEDSDRDENVFGTLGRATDYFIPESYRPGQREAIEDIEAAFERGYRYVLVEAPTGSGKSHIARSLAFESGSAHILTVQKILQSQYESDFDDMAIVKGRSSYECLMSLVGETCADGPCQRSAKAPKCSECPYTLALNRAMASAVAVHNFDSFFFQCTYARRWTGRKLLIVDEAHNIESKYGGFMTFSISSEDGLDIPEYDDIESYDPLIARMYGVLSREFATLESLFEVSGLSRNDLKRFTHLRRVLATMSRYLKDRESARPVDYVFEYEHGSRGDRVKFRPVLIGDFAVKSLFRYGERVLMMSATVLDKRQFCAGVGLDPDEVAFIQVPSHFPVENRPILKKYAGKMTYREIDGNLPNLVETIREILDKFPTRKGIIQTHSEKIAGYIKNHLDDPRLTHNKDYVTPEDMLTVHATKPGSFIVASGLREGVDLYGELSQIQIFCKIPYPSLGYKWVKARSAVDDEWYGYITTLMFVQALGRSIRSASDKAVTYILDSGFGYYYTKNKRFIPDYIREAIRW